MPKTHRHCDSQFLTHLLTKLHSAARAPLLLWLSVPLYWLQQAVPGPIPASSDSACGAVTLGEVTMHLLRGCEMLAYPGKKLIFPVQQLDKQGFVQTGLRGRLLHRSQNRTGFCAEKLEVEVKHHCSIPTRPLILWFKMVSLVSHGKWSHASSLRVRFLRQIFSRKVIYFSWRLAAFQELPFLIWQWHFS